MNENNGPRTPVWLRRKSKKELNEKQENVVILEQENESESVDRKNPFLATPSTPTLLNPMTAGQRLVHRRRERSPSLVKKATSKSIDNIVDVQKQKKKKKKSKKKKRTTTTTTRVLASTMQMDMSVLQSRRAVVVAQRETKITVVQRSSASSKQTLEPKLKRVEALLDESEMGAALLTDDVDVSLKGLRSLPELGEHWSSVRSLMARHNNLRLLPYADRLASLHTLDLFDNRLRTLPVDLALLGASLRTLNISYNKLSAMPPSLTALTSLTSLSLGWNDIKVLPGAMLLSLGSLTALDMRSNRLRYLPIELGTLTQLRSLQLRRNRLSILPSQIGQLVQLRELGLMENRLSELPYSLGSLTALKKLLLSDNALLSIPLRALRTLKELARFDFSDNLLTSFGAAAAADDSDADADAVLTISTFDVTNNKLMKLPDYIYPQFANVSRLVLMKNHLIELPESIGRLVKLRELDASENQLRELPASLAQLEALEVLDVSRNLLHSAERLGAILSETRELRELNIGSNEFDVLPDSVGALRHLYSLNAFNNRLSELPESLVNIVPFVSPYARTPLPKRLLLSYNRFARVPPVVCRLAGLNELHIAGNQLESIPDELPRALYMCRLLSLANNRRPLALPDSIGQMRSLERLYLRGTPIRQPVPASFAMLLTHMRDFPRPPRWRGQQKNATVDHKNDSNRRFDALLTPFGTAQMIGSAHKNEDTLACRARFLRTGGGDNVSSSFAVFDGHGGRDASSYARQHFHRVLEERIALIEAPLAQSAANASKRRALLVRALHDTFVQVDGEMLAHFDANNIKYRQGCTAVTALLYGTDLIVCNVGDARLVYCNGERIVRLTRDHTPELRDEVKRVRRARGLVQEVSLDHRHYRVSQVFRNSGFGGTCVSRSLGDFHLMPLISPEPHIVHVDLTNVLVSSKSASSSSASASASLAAASMPNLVNILASNAPTTSGDDDDDDDDAFPPSSTSALSSSSAILNIEPSAFFILASDGVWDVLSDEEACDVARRYSDPWAGAAAVRDHAYLNGSYDDISVIVVHLS
jgi:serine/threonine protein phosphatase PrpC/Leucine-rich repeat (LRR) protein